MSRKTLIYFIKGILLFLLPNFLFGQNHYLDSLKKVTLETHLSNKEKIELLGKLAKTQSAENQTQEALENAKEALRLSWAEKDAKYSANIHSIFGYIYI